MVPENGGRRLARSAAHPSPRPATVVVSEATRRSSASDRRTAGVQLPQFVGEPRAHAIRRRLEVGVVQRLARFGERRDDLGRRRLPAARVPSRVLQRLAVGGVALRHGEEVVRGSLRAPSPPSPPTDRRRCRDLRPRRTSPAEPRRRRRPSRSRPAHTPRRPAGRPRPRRRHRRLRSCLPPSSSPPPHAASTNAPTTSSTTNRDRFIANLRRIRSGMDRPPESRPFPDPDPVAARERWRRPDSNRRPPPCKGGALPTELRPHPDDKAACRPPRPIVSRRSGSRSARRSASRWA